MDALYEIILFFIFISPVILQSDIIIELCKLQLDILELSPEEILKTEIGWCEPWKFCFDSNGNLSSYEIIPRNSEPSKSNLYKT